MRKSSTYPLSVNHSDHYALRIPGGSFSLLLSHASETVNGIQYNIQSDGMLSPITGVIYQPLFEFSINTKDCKFDMLIVEF